MMLHNPTRRIVIGQPPTGAKEVPPTQRVQAIICDIEGTTTSISFVKDVLFPYALEHVQAHLTDTWTESGTQTVVRLLRTEAAADVLAAVPGAIAVPDPCETDAERATQIEALVRIVQWQMAADRKATPLKMLQGQIWAKAYQSGLIKGHVFDDVPLAMDDWLAAGVRVGIYSSGSVAAQKLLFGHSVHGDMVSRLNGGLYDTQIGSKLESASYAAICKQLDCQANVVAFLTDSVGEANAAQEAGMTAILLDRPGNLPISDADRLKFPVVKSFADITLEDQKRKRSDSDAEITDDDRSAAQVDQSNGKSSSPAEVDESEVRPSKMAKIEATIDELPVQLESINAGSKEKNVAEDDATSRKTTAVEVDKTAANDVDDDQTNAVNETKIAAEAEVDESLAVSSATVTNGNGAISVDIANVASSANQPDKAIKEVDLVQDSVTANETVVADNAHVAAVPIADDVVQMETDGDEIADDAKTELIDSGKVVSDENVDVGMPTVLKSSAKDTAADIASEVAQTEINADVKATVCSNRNGSVDDDAMIEEPIVADEPEKTEKKQPIDKEDTVVAVTATEESVEPHVLTDVIDSSSNAENKPKITTIDSENTILVNGDQPTTTTSIPAAIEIMPSTEPAERMPAKVQSTCRQLYDAWSTYIDETSKSPTEITVLRAALQKITNQSDEAAFAKPTEKQSIAAVELDGYYLNSSDVKLGSPKQIHADEEDTTKTENVTFLTDIESVYKALQMGLSCAKPANNTSDSQLKIAKLFTIQNNMIIVETAEPQENADSVLKDTVESVVEAKQSDEKIVVETSDSDSVKAVSSIPSNNASDLEREDQATATKHDHNIEATIVDEVNKMKDSNGMISNSDAEATTEKPDDHLENKTETTDINEQLTSAPKESKDVDVMVTDSSSITSNNHNTTEHEDHMIKEQSTDVAKVADGENIAESPNTQVTLPQQTDQQQTPETPLEAVTSPLPITTTKTDQPEETTAGQNKEDPDTEKDTATKPDLTIVATKSIPIAYQPTDASEKVSRVEITIESIDKQPGQTTQTTTTIVKEICIKEQLISTSSIGDATVTSSDNTNSTNSSSSNVISCNAEQTEQATVATTAAAAKKRHFVVNVEAEPKEKKTKLESTTAVAKTSNGDGGNDANDDSDNLATIAIRENASNGDISAVAGVAVAVVSLSDFSTATAADAPHDVPLKDATGKQSDIDVGGLDNAMSTDDGSDKENDTIGTATVNGADPANVPIVPAGADSNDTVEKMDVTEHVDDEADTTVVQAKSMNSVIIEQQPSVAVAEAMTA